MMNQLVVLAVCFFVFMFGFTAGIDVSQLVKPGPHYEPSWYDVVGGVLVAVSLYLLLVYINSMDGTYGRDG